MKITKRWLKKWDACDDEYEWYIAQKTEDAEKLYRVSLKEKKYSAINWVIARKLKKIDRVRYALYAAKQVIDVFEKKYPKDDRPRKAIEAAENYIRRPSSEAAAAASSSSSYAAYASAAAYAASCASAAVAYAYAAAYTKEKVYKKILSYGWKLLNSEATK
jgi:hypothetical protein